MLVFLELNLCVLERLALVFLVSHSRREGRLARRQSFRSGRQSVAKGLRTLVQLVQVSEDY